MKQQLQKWTSQAGPRQTKLVQAAFSQLQRVGQSHVEIYGGPGQPESRSVLWSPFGEYSEVFLLGWEQLGTKYTWTITRENHKEIVELAVLLAKEINSTLPEVDKRTKPEDIAKRNAQAKEAQQKREEQARQDDSEADRLKAEYPNLIQEGTDGARGNTLAAKNIRIELARAFPSQKFSVKSSSFSMGNDVTVSWTDGPSTKAVDVIVRKYQYGSFDGMQDLYEYNNSVFCRVFGGTKYTSCNRGLSAATKAAVEAWAKERFEAGETFGCYSPDNMAYRLMIPYSLPPEAVVTGVEPTGETCGTSDPAVFYKPVAA